MNECKPLAQGGLNEWLVDLLVELEKYERFGNGTFQRAWDADPKEKGVPMVGVVQVETPAVSACRQRLQLKHDEQLSSFASNFNLCPCSTDLSYARAAAVVRALPVRLKFPAGSACSFTPTSSRFSST